MLEYLLSQLQDRLDTSIDKLIEEKRIDKNLLNRMQRIVSNCSKELKIHGGIHFTYDEINEILEGDVGGLDQFKGQPGVMFYFLMPVVEWSDEDGLSISLPLDFQVVN